MPTHEYLCKSCNRRIVYLCSISHIPESLECECGKSMIRLIGNPPHVFTGGSPTKGESK